MKRKAPTSQDESSKRRKQESMDTSTDDNPQVRSMHAELSALKTREIADISQSAASLPHMTFGKRPIKLKSKTAKPGASTTATANNTTTLGGIPEGGHLSISKSKFITDTTLTSKQKIIEKQKQQARRSSFGQRGKRTKGSFEQGESVMPHESVPSDKLYRHVDIDLPEPHRARHLLVWCARRAAAPIPAAAQDKGKGKNKAGKLGDADSAIVASVQDKIVKQLMDLTIDIPLYDISGGSGRDFLKGKGKGEPLAEDPVNARNREHKERLAQAEERAREEDAMWSKVIQDYNSLQSTVLSTLPDPPLVEPRDGGKPRQQSLQQILDVRLSELDGKWRQVDEELESYRAECERGSELDTKLAKRCKMLPMQLDSLHQSLQRSTAFTEQAKEFIDQLFSSIDPLSKPQPVSLPSTTATAGGSNNKSLPNLFSALHIASDPSSRVPPGDSADLFRALAKTDGPADGGRYDGVMEDRRVMTVVQPSTPRRMPGTPRRAGEGGGGGGSALRKG